MSDKPIIFSPAMVRALLDGSKTQTRRLLKPQPRNDWGIGGAEMLYTDWIFRHGADGSIVGKFKVPIAVGDRLWVRENCAAIELQDGSDVILYPADGSEILIPNTMEAADRWGAMNHYGNRRSATVPSIHMPRWASRLTLTVTDVRVQRLKGTTLGDICAEGLARSIYDFKPVQLGLKAWEDLWDSLNAERAPFASNPWVIAYTFTLENQNIDGASV